MVLDCPKCPSEPDDATLLYRLSALLSCYIGLGLVRKVMEVTVVRPGSVVVKNGPDGVLEGLHRKNGINLCECYF